MKQAIMPLILIQKLVENMVISETAYITPWSLIIDEQRNVWVNKAASIQNKQHGTSSVKLTKESNGFVADISNVHKDNLWYVDDDISDDDLEPITKLNS